MEMGATHTKEPTVGTGETAGKQEGIAAHAGCLPRAESAHWAAAGAERCDSSREDHAALPRTRVGRG